MSIKVRNLVKKFGTFTAVNDLSFDVAKGHIVGFLGPNGAGKTTTIRMIAGLSASTSGSIEVSDIPVIFGNSKSNYKIGYLPEQPSFYLWMSGMEYMSFVADIFKLSKGVKQKRIASLLKLVNLWDSRNKKISTYSNGMKQRLGIAQALVNDPEVLIFDEPVSALDPIGRKDVLEIIEKLKSDKTILLSTHILSDVDKICDDVVVINHGKLVANAPLAELKSKYAGSILEIELSKSPSQILADLKKQSWAKKADCSGNLVKIWLFDNQAINDDLPLKYFARLGLGVVKYGLRLPEMEDLFVELVGGKDE